MSLAATLAADGVRPVSFLPSIKCSTCGEELDIAEMGDHVCDNAQSTPTISAPEATSPINPFTLRRMKGSGQSNDAHTTSQSRSTPSKNKSRSAWSRVSKAIPKINLDAANKPFLAPKRAPLDSPVSPAPSSRSGSRLGKPQVFRSMTSPIPRLFDPRPPSPELTANLDCAFPPFPTPAISERRPSTSHSSHGRKKRASSERRPSQGGSQPEAQRFDPSLKSPIGNEAVLQKLNTLKSGPFTADRRQGSNDSSKTAVEDGRRPSIAPVGNDNRPCTATSSDLTSGQSSADGFDQKSLQEAQQRKRTPPPRPERPPEEVSGLSFVDQMREEPASLGYPPLSMDGTERACGQNDTSISHQVGNSSPSPRLSGAKGEPRLRSPERRPSLESARDEGFSNGSDTPPHGSPRRDELENRSRGTPPVPQAVRNYRQEITHAPSESNSSVTSSTNSRSNTYSSGVSPVGSIASSLDTFSPVGIEQRKDGEDEHMRVPALSVRSVEKPGVRAEQPTSHPSLRTLAGSELSQDMLQMPTEVATTPVESPLDPVMLGVRKAGPAYEPWPPSTPSRPSLPRTQTAPVLTTMDSVLSTPISTLPRSRTNDVSDSALASHKHPQSNSSPQGTAPSSRDLSPSTLQPPPVPSETQARRQHGRRPTNAKPMCRGCGQTIEGKSVKAADGRLTGRWHKACFVCRSCRSPFMTADFYVINNEPYCEQHYHEQNGSVCHGCHRGIEGQYLETSSSTRFGSVDKKFHPRCFTCCECRLVLAQDYFEITGRVYCERHALAAMRVQARQGSGLRPPDRKGLLAERRTTRLINPILA